MTIPSKWLDDTRQISNASSTLADFDPHVTAVRTGGFGMSWTAFSSATETSLRETGASASGVSSTSLFIDFNNVDETQISLFGLHNGSLAIVWANKPDATSDSDIQAVILDPNGGALSAPRITVNVGDTAGNQVRPEVAELSTGRLAFAWFDDAAHTVQAAVFDSLGQLSVSNIAVSTSADADSSVDLGLTALSNGNFVVSWAGTTTDHFRIIGSFGTFVTAEIALPTADGSTDVTALANGDFVVSYFRGSTGLAHLAEIFHADGTLSVPEFQLSTSNGLQATSALLDGRFMIVYDTGGDIFGRIWNADGTPGSDEFRVNSDTTGTQIHPHLETMVDGRVAVSWEDSRTGGGDIYYTILDPRENGIDVAGTGFNDEYFGSAFSDTLSGGDGNDKLHGADGRDLLIGGAGDDQLFGDAGNDDMRGGTGSDTLNGGDGADTMVGNVGNDTYLVDNAGDQIIENVGEGTDTVVASFNFTLPINFEVLALNGSALNATGNSANNFIHGNALGNSIDGAGGADMMFGRAGNDTYFVEDRGDQVTENAGEGADTVVSEINYTLGANVEVLALSRFAAIGTGNSLDNLLFGNDQDNLLDGATGADDMRGGAGNDTYVVDNVGDRIIENLNEGTDEVVSSVNYVLGANAEKLQLVGSAITANGNESDNVIRGNALDNIINGGSGSDILAGAGGRDTFVFRFDAGGQDTVADLDLTANSDFLAFGTTLYANSADVLAHSAQVGVDVVITHDPAHTITLQNTALATFTAHSGDFQFI